MKKTGFALMVVLAAGVSISSCKKDYTCSCEVQIPADSGNGFVVLAQDSSFSIDYNDISKKDANTNCNNTEKQADTTAKLFDGTANCELK